MKQDSCNDVDHGIYGKAYQGKVIGGAEPKFSTENAGPDQPCLRWCDYAKVISDTQSRPSVREVSILLKLFIPTFGRNKAQTIPGNTITP